MCKYPRKYFFSKTMVVGRMMKNRRFVVKYRISVLLHTHFMFFPHVKG